MEIYHYYAATQMKRLSHELLPTPADSMMTALMLEFITSQCASGTPPFVFAIPDDAAWYVLKPDWGLNRALFRPEIVSSNRGNEPIGTATIFFLHCIVFLHYRRCINTAAYTEGPCS